ncbi:alternative ribosome rescue aminoacyl-tRNA hydrolase ArfB [Roseivirga pacifica]|uniref:alternative ribosome rescue aminoacyl-tRNA hydrolase ArfB n=1 Tax=Roseivirga pacifica TaxID=1267423 RepID=UPI00227C1B4B|nr:alternative ribosome rescue aminoacyl-tRNA hydrolase ArfB [Roseivirga pacifica]
MKFDPQEIASRDFSAELKFETSRSSGPGGQNVNKTESRVTLRFAVTSSEVLCEEERTRLQQKLANKLTSEGELLISSEKHRGQLQNKEETVKLFQQILTKAFTEPKKRKKTKPSKAAVQKRIDGKKKLGEKKANRRKPDF